MEFQVLIFIAAVAREHLTSIRSPVLTGGSGAGSFLYMEDGVPLRAAGFSNVNGLFEASPEFSNQIEVLKGPGPVQYGSNAVHGLINFQNKRINDDKLTFYTERGRIQVFSDSNYLGLTSRRLSFNFPRQRL